MLFCLTLLPLFSLAPSLPLFFLAFSPSFFPHVLLFFFVSSFNLSLPSSCLHFCLTFYLSSPSPFLLFFLAIHPLLFPHLLLYSCLPYLATSLRRLPLFTSALISCFTVHLFFSSLTSSFYLTPEHLKKRLQKII